MIVFCGRFSTLFSVSLNQKGRIILFSHTFGSRRILTPESSKKNSELQVRIEVMTIRVLTTELLEALWKAGLKFNYYNYTSQRGVIIIYIFFCTLGMNIILVYSSLLLHPLHESWHDICICCGSILTLVYFVPSGGKL